MRELEEALTLAERRFRETGRSTLRRVSAQRHPPQLQRLPP